jgi:hypothetical protein
MLPTVEQAIHHIDPDLPLEKPMTQAAVFEDSYSQQRLFSRLAMFFALLAALLVGIGVAVGTGGPLIPWEILRKLFRQPTIALITPSQSLPHAQLLW